MWGRGCGGARRGQEGVSLIRVKKTATTAQPRQPPTSRPAAKRQHTRAPPSTTSVGVWREKLCQERSGWSRRGWGAGSSHPQRQQQHSQKPCAKKVIEPLLAPPLHIALPLTPPPLRHPPKQLVPPPSTPSANPHVETASTHAGFVPSSHPTHHVRANAQGPDPKPRPIPNSQNRLATKPILKPPPPRPTGTPPPLPTQQAASK